MEETQHHLSEKQKDLYQRVRDYGYAYSDDTDKMIIRFIKAGALDKDEMLQRVQENDTAIAKRQRDEAIERAWEVYRGTLRPNVEEVVTALYDAHLAGIEDVSASHLAQAVRVIRELGAEDKANELTQRFFSRSAPIDNYDSYPFKEMGHDERFVEKWREKTAAEAPDERTLEETINSYYYDKSNAMTDFKRLAQFGEDEFYEWFKGTRNPKVLSMASALSQIQYRLPLAQTEIEKIERDARAALRRISAEDKISEVRLRHLFRDRR